MPYLECAGDNCASGGEQEEKYKGYLSSWRIEKSDEERGTK